MADVSRFGNRLSCCQKIGEYRDEHIDADLWYCDDAADTTSDPIMSLTYMDGDLMRAPMCFVRSFDPGSVNKYTLPAWERLLELVGEAATFVGGDE